MLCALTFAADMVLGEGALVAAAKLPKRRENRDEMVGRN